MKVMEESSEITVLEARRNKLESKLSLKFHNDSLEQDFKSTIITGLSRVLGINLSETYSPYLQVYIGVCSLYCISYIFSYSKRTLNQIFMFRMILLIALCLIYSVIIITIILTKMSIKLVPKVHTFFYIITCFVIILNTDQVQEAMFPGKTDPSFNSILGLLPLIYASKCTVFKDFLNFFIVNLVLAVFFLVISLTLSENYLSAIIESLFLFLVNLCETVKFYYQEKEAREKFLAMRKYLNPLIVNEKRSSPKTDIEEISRKVKESIEIVKNLSSENINNIYSCQQMIENLSSISRMIATGSSLYSVDMEQLSNSIDEDDKVFIKETCAIHSDRRKVISGKVKLNKSAEILQNFEVAELAVLLKRIGKEWNFDTFFVADITKNRTLATVGEFCLKRFHISATFKIEEKTYQSFLSRLEELYKPNPYHNSSHAADVLCSCLFFIRQSVLSDMLLDLELFGAIIACLGHDVAHPGLTNRFLINSQDPLSLLYNDMSVLEMMHCSTTFKLMEHSECNILENLSHEQRSILRTQVIDLVLSTDMAKHFDLVGKFKAKIMNSDSFNFDSCEQRMEVLKIIMKASDVGHAAKSVLLHKKWSKLVIQEFFEQGDLEKNKGLPISMYCDRDKTNVPKSQCGFIKNIVMPIYESLYLCLNSPSIKESCVDQLETNILAWSLSAEKKRVQTHITKRKRDKDRGGSLLAHKSNPQSLLSN